MPSKLATVAVAAALALLALAPGASATRSNASVAALQVALRALHHYHGSIDGLRGPRTKAATRHFQRAHHLTPDGVAGPRTRRALGRRGRPTLGSRIMRRGHRGWDVAALQFMLRRRGYSAGSVDGGFGLGTLSAVKRFQSAHGLAVDGRAGHATIKALRHRRRSRRHIASGPAPSGPVRFLRPVRAPMGDGFGYPGGRRHDGIDFPAPYGTPVGAAGRGTVVFAGWNSGGYGNLMVVQHRLGFQTWYAHLSSFTVGNGASVAGGVQIARVGSTGRSTGPHLHFEVRHNGVPINPLPYLLAQTSLKVLLGGQPEHHDCMDRDRPDQKAGASPPLRQSPAGAVLAGC